MAWGVWLKAHASWQKVGMASSSGSAKVACRKVWGYCNQAHVGVVRTWQQVIGSSCQPEGGADVG